MEKIVFDHVVYRIPTQWSDVTLKMLIDADELSNVLETAPLVVILSTYTGIPIKKLSQAKTCEVEEIMNKMQFLQTPYTPTPSNSFMFNDVEYSCKDDLVDQSFEDYISVQTALFNHKDNPVKALPYLVAIMCKKEGETLDQFSLKERAKEFESLPMTTAKDIEGFFLHLTNVYNSVTRLSSIPNLQEEIVLAKLKELRDTAKAYKAQTGIFSLTRLRVGILLLYLRYAKVVLERYFNSIRSKP